MVVDVVAVVLFGIFVILVVVLCVAFTRATRLARRPARADGFRYTFYGLIARLIAGAPASSAQAKSSSPADGDVPTNAAGRRRDRQ